VSRLPNRAQRIAHSLDRPEGHPSPVGELDAAASARPAGHVASAADAEDARLINRHLSYGAPMPSVAGIATSEALIGRTEVARDGSVRVGGEQQRRERIERERGWRRREVLRREWLPC
jgi:hypothetical protein